MLAGKRLKVLIWGFPTKIIEKKGQAMRGKSTNT